MRKFKFKPEKYYRRKEILYTILTALCIILCSISAEFSELRGGSIRYLVVFIISASIGVYVGFKLYYYRIFVEVAREYEEFVYWDFALSKSKNTKALGGLERVRFIDDYDAWQKKRWKYIIKMT